MADTSASSVKVRIKKDIEQYIQVLAERYGVEPYSIRNIALLIGLKILSQYLGEEKSLDEVVKRVAGVREVSVST